VFRQQHGEETLPVTKLLARTGEQNARAVQRPFIGWLSRSLTLRLPHHTLRGFPPIEHDPEKW